jgi:hypothetical protein
VPVVLVIVAIVVLAGVVFVSTGRGGEMAYEHVDHAPLEMGPVSATDVVLLRPPTALWGYNMQVTDEALEQIAAAIRDRDVRIVALEQRIVDLRAGAGDAPSPAARHARRDPPPTLAEMVAAAPAFAMPPLESQEPAAEPVNSPVVPENPRADEVAHEEGIGASVASVVAAEDNVAAGDKVAAEGKVAAEDNVAGEAEETAGEIGSADAGRFGEVDGAGEVDDDAEDADESIEVGQTDPSTGETDLSAGETDSSTSSTGQIDSADG